MDYYQITFDKADDYAIILDEMPDGKDYDLAIYNQTGKQVAVSATVNDVEFIKIENVKANESYYAKIYGYNSQFDKQATYRLQYAPFVMATDEFW